MNGPPVRLSEWHFGLKSKIEKRENQKRNVCVVAFFRGK